MCARKVAAKGEGSRRHLYKGGMDGEETGERISINETKNSTSVGCICDFIFFSLSLSIALLSLSLYLFLFFSSLSLNVYI